MNSVKITSDAYLACLIHALSTEREEVMGLLLGEISDNKANICSVCMMRRSDKQADRVEISPEQLSAAAIEAETLAVKLNKKIQVLGWYHSHPHITVWPSHVDVRTQADYQTMAQDFIGLIFSCFHEVDMKYSLKVICFQSIPKYGDSNSYEYIKLPLQVLPSLYSTINPICVGAIVHLINILSEEERDTFLTNQKSCQDEITQIHNGAVYVQSLSHLLQVLGGPVLQLIEHKIQDNNKVIQQLTTQREELKLLLSSNETGYSV